jgi:hypothetical protein
MEEIFTKYSPFVYRTAYFLIHNHFAGGVIVYEEPLVNTFKAY